MGKALELFKVSYDLYQENNNLTSIARTLRDIAFVENKLGRPEKAIDCINESIGIYEKYNEYDEMAASLGYLGVIYKDLGQFEKAKESHQRALEIQKLREEYARSITAFQRYADLFMCLIQFIMYKY